MKADTFDVIVIGGGAAGLSAALVLGRARRRVAVIDSGEPRNASAAHMHGYLSRDGTPPADLLRRGREEARGYGVEFVAGEVQSVEQGFFVRVVAGEALEARRLLLTMGATDVLPDIPGAAERWGRDFLHCPYCHGWEVRDQPLGVLSSGPGSVEHAHLLRQWSKDVAFLAHNHELPQIEREQLEARGIRVVYGEVQQLVVERDSLAGVELAGGQIVSCKAVFIRPNMRARGADLSAHLGCEVDDLGFVRVDSGGSTSVAGVWAAGNVTDPRAQVITAAGEGSAAAISINTDLVQEETQDASCERPR
jgi:thioredoxin reductase